MRRPSRIPAVFVLAVAALAMSACGGGKTDKTADAAARRTTTSETATSTSSSAPAPARTAAAAEGASGIPRRVEVEMAEFAFQPASIDVKAGETIAFVFTNRGKLPHDAFLGAEDEQAEHEKAMQAMTGESHAGHEGGITVQPNQTGAIRRTFTEPGTTFIGCHQAGHYDAGMKLTITVR